MSVSSLSPPSHSPFTHGVRPGMDTLQRGIAVQTAVAPASPFDALADLLHSTATVIEGLDDMGYTERRFPNVSGSIGQHVRHLLDHVAVLAQASRHNTISYDHRRRDTSVEHDRVAALEAVREISRNLRTLRIDDLDRPLTVTSMLGPGCEVTGTSSLARELAFVASHTTHHQALIAVLVAARGQSVPGRFGVAPSTPWPSRA